MGHEFGKVVGVFGGLFVVFLLIFMLTSTGRSFLDITNSNKEKEEPVYVLGVVTDKLFTNGTSSTTVGAGVTVNGITSGNTQVGVIPVVGSTSSSDEFIIFIDGIKYDVRNAMWAKVEKGDTVEYIKSAWGGIKELNVIKKEEELKTEDEYKQELEELKKQMEEIESKMNKEETK